MEVVLEDQILRADSVEEVTSDANPFKKLVKKEQRLLARLQEEQEAEVRAHDRFQRAKARLQRRRKRLERIQRKLVHVQEQLAKLHITDQQPEYIENEHVIVPTSDPIISVDSEEATIIQPEQDTVVAHEPDELSPTYVESPILDTSIPAQEATALNTDESDVPVTGDDEEKGIEQEHPAPEQDTTIPAHFTYEPIEALVESEPGATPEETSEGETYAQEQESSSTVLLTSTSFESTPVSEASSHVEVEISNTSESEHETAQELEASSLSPIESTAPTTLEQEPTTSIDALPVEPKAEVSDDADISSETNNERQPTKPLRLELAGPPASESLSPDVQSAKEAWVVAESAMQNARNAAHGIAASITFLSQTDGISSEFMEELVHKQADANKELLKAQDAARAAYERFVQAQRDNEPAASQPVDAQANTAEDDAERKQVHVSLPPAEENGLDQTTKLHAVRLYKEW
jgi:hypothetical protein